MVTIKTFPFNPFYENTYVLSDETGECVIIDPGCHNAEEEQELKSYIEKSHLRPVKLLNTHCHIDHVFGNPFVSETWKLSLEINALEVKVLESFPMVCQMYGFNGKIQPEPVLTLEEGKQVKFGNTTLDIFFTPGHSPGSVCFYNAKEKFAISGDVLFQGSIGRSDLPGGSAAVLLNSIREKLFVLPDDVKIYSGHGGMTKIGI
ncbi:MAG TPA: MBL fold metallo-hydrolase, partial [Bacteroidia bacterium]|nr:MBL fold metallo-hydrolase [Bacteroidia bacterium]